MTNAEKKAKLFNMIMDAQVGCRPVQFSISDRHQDFVSATIYDAPSFALVKLFEACDKDRCFARIEVNHGELMIVCW